MINFVKIIYEVYAIYRCSTCFTCSIFHSGGSRKRVKRLQNYILSYSKKILSFCPSLLWQYLFQITVFEIMSFDKFIVQINSVLHVFELLLASHQDHDIPFVQAIFLYSFIKIKKQENLSSNHDILKYSIFN